MLMLPDTMEQKGLHNIMANINVVRYTDMNQSISIMQYQCHVRRIKFHLCNKSFKIFQVGRYLFLDDYKFTMDDNLKLLYFINVF